MLRLAYVYCAGDTDSTEMYYVPNDRALCTACYVRKHTFLQKYSQG